MAARIAPLSTGPDAGNRRRVVAVAAATAAVEWYAFFAYVLLAVPLAARFFPGLGEGAALPVIATYAAGFLMRPVGALLFGRLGDAISRRHAFLLTMAVMGGTTLAMGLLPTYRTVGALAPLLLVMLRLAQGIAIGGAHAGAAVYVAEHAPERRRGLATSWVQAAGAVGLLMALIVVGAVREALDPSTFAEWGWRVPLLIAPLLLLLPIRAVSRLDEPPVFERLAAETVRSEAPLADAIRYPSGKYLLVAILGATAAQGVVWYATQLHVLTFLTDVLQVEDVVAYLLVGTALLVGLPFFVFFGWLSDRIGRLKIIAAGCLIAVLTLFPLFQGLLHFANPALEEYRQKNPIAVAASDCGFRAVLAYERECAKVKDFLTRSGLSFASPPAPAGGTVVTTIGAAEIKGWNPQALAEALRQIGYPPAADPARIDYGMTLLLLSALAIFAAMITGPMAAFLAEVFAARVRYTSVGLASQMGEGAIGGFMPIAAAAMSAGSGNIYQGLWYPVAVALVSLVVGMLFLRETKDRSIQALDYTLSTSAR